MNKAFSIIGLLSLAAGTACLLVALVAISTEKITLEYPKIPTGSSVDATYSALTGEPLADGGRLNAPTYCVQTPNGTDGARPQAGLNQAGVIFEAIAEAGITRFAAIYQDPSAAIIGPIRSLRLYYLQWDTPFDCTIVHAGGADDALAAVASGGYRDLSENYQYMYRGTYGGRLWNNLFTTANYLRQFGEDRGFDTSDVKGFAHMTPQEAEKNKINVQVAEKLAITKPTTESTSRLTPPVAAATFRLGGWGSFNVVYQYNQETNTYLRSYENGEPHNVYSCPAEDLGERNPEDVCTLVQLSPSVVIAMVVQETKASDGYHEDITTTGTGPAYIFQNGTAIVGTWRKDSPQDQLKFADESGNEVKLVPGQTFLTAVPEYGGVDF